MRIKAKADIIKRHPRGCFFSTDNNRYPDIRAGRPEEDACSISIPVFILQKFKERDWAWKDMRWYCWGRSLEWKKVKKSLYGETIRNLLELLSIMFLACDRITANQYEELAELLKTIDIKQRYSDLFQLGILIVSIIALCVQIRRK